ncbi:response regulator [Polaromonas sp. JS666]|uniref:PAS/PAC sensor hybrid histidine kinase n=1 Tax=Polaromonas sp. (strain JS666 / ATCC BAA-500) TaxID=296591 RepID=A0ACD6B897_POLSJ|nr:response regulator [Polaromonas sp. JS666]ABE46702.1 PAS/PAC sensor hybrid histidine kinase [Polaromonas sp. JS666]
MTPQQNRHILLVDDMPSIHEDFRKILAAKPGARDLDDAEAALFGQAASPSGEGFELDSAYQGLEGVARVEAAVQAGRPYAMAFVDMRMPPGLDGVETIARLWRIDPQVQIVICTAYSDYPWEEVLARLDAQDRLLIIKKPFDMIEVSQLARTLTAKWELTRQATLQMGGLENAVKERARALRASESQLRQITDTVPALIAYVDAEQRFQFHNLAYEEGFGLKRDQIHGKTMREMMGDALYEKERGKIEEALSGYAVQYDRVQKTADGQLRDYIMQYFPRYGEDQDEGKVVGLFSLGTDVTELRRIDRMKSEFVSTVSHELRTPLTSIRGSLGLIAGGVAGELPAMAKSLVGIASNNCERLIRLINDILDSEKIESGKMHFELQQVELQPLLAQALAANEGFAGQHNVKLALDAPADAVRVSVDSDRLTQVVTNLLSNAVKFSPPASCVHIRLLRSGGRVRVEVADSGPGILEEFRKRIFQKFSQADTSDTRQKGGTGLGLNISRAIVEQMGGSMGFTTKAGVGTVFHFELPEASPLPVEDRDSAAPRPRILICEDDPDIARLLNLMLEKGGFDSDMVHSAAQALEQVARRPYAAMTVDLNLPDQDGVSLIRALRRDSRTRDLAIVVVSANAREGELEFNSQPLAVSTWLEKPIDENLLILSLHRAIDNMAEGKPRILHVEDDLDIQRIAAAIAQNFATFEFACTLQEARDQLASHHYDLVLLDLTLKDGSGWELLSTIEALDPAPPVVVFSASKLNMMESQRVEAVLVKADTSNEELIRVLQRVLDDSLWGTVDSPLST